MDKAEDNEQSFNCDEKNKSNKRNIHTNMENIIIAIERDAAAKTGINKQ